VAAPEPERVAPAVVSDDSPSAISGWVWQPDGSPAADVEIALRRHVDVVASGFPQTGEIWNVEPALSASTGPEGQFAFEDVEPGRWWISLRHDENTLHLMRTPLAVAGGFDQSDLSLRLPAMSTRTGSTRSPSGDGVAGASIHFAAEHGSGWIVSRAQSNASGTFEVASIGRPRSTRLAVIAGGWGSVSERNWGMRQSNGEGSNAITLLPGATVEGVVHQANGLPLAGAKVWATPAENSTRLLSAVATTDDRGTFRLTDLPDGQIDLRAAAPGHRIEEALPLVTIPGETLEGAMLSMRSASRLSGTLTGPDGEPAAGALVRLLPPEGLIPTDFGGFGGFQGRRDSELPLGRPDLWTRADQSGAFSFEGVAAGEERTVFVMADAAAPERFRGLVSDRAASLTLPRGATLMGEVFSLPEQSVLSQAQVRVVEESMNFLEETFTSGRGTFQMHFLPPGSTDISAAAPRHARGSRSNLLTRADRITSDVRLNLTSGVTISGQVRNQITNEPIAMAEVGLFRRGDERTSVETDSGGSFVVEHVAPGTWVLDADAPRYLRSRPLNFSVEEANLFGMDLLLEPSAVIQGRFADTDGRPVVGASVGSRYVGRGGWGGGRGGGPGGRGGRWGFQLSTFTDAQGRYTLEDVQPDRELRVVGLHPDHARGESETVRVEPGALLEPVNVTMTDGGTIVGKVIDMDGRAIAEAEVRQGLEEGGGGPGGGRGGGIRGVQAILLRAVQDGENVTHSRSNGTFRFEHLAPGSYSVVARTPEHAYEVAQNIVVAEGMETDEIVIQLREGVEILGSVVDQAGVPIVDAQVSARLMERDRPMFERTVTDAEGLFRLTGLDERTFTLSAGAEGYDQTSQEVPAPSAGVEIVLDRGGSISGHVVDALSGAPIPQFSIEAARQGRGGGRGGPFGGGPFGGGGGGRISGSFSDPSGHFEIEGLVAGEWTLTAVSPGHSPGEVTDVPVSNEGQTEGVTILMKTGATVRGQVVNAADEPIIGAVVEMDDQPQAQNAWGGPPQFNRRLQDVRQVTDENGEFTITGVLPGEQELRAEAAGHMGSRVDIVVPETGDPNPVTITLHQGGRLVGRVVSSLDGKSVQGARIALPDESYVEDMAWELVNRGATTSADGSFLMTMVPAGNLRLEVSHPDFAEFETQPFVIREGRETNTGDIALSGGGRIFGYAFDAEGDLVAGARVTANGPNGTEAAQTNEDGEFSFDRLTPGSYRVSLNQGGGRNGTQVSQSVTVREDEETEVVLAREPGFTVSGTVTDEGQPVEGIEVRLTLLGGENPLGESGVAQSDAQGDYSIENLSPGEYSVDVTQRQRRNRIPLRRDTLTIRSGDVTNNIALPRSTISGRVTNTAGDGINRAEVAILRDDVNDITSLIGFNFSGSETTRTNGNGEYELERVEEGSFTLVARRSADGYAYATEDITLGYGEALTDVNFTLAVGNALVGRATANGQPVTRFDAAIVNESGTQVFGDRVNVSNDGAYRIGGLAAGKHTLTAYPSGLAPEVGLEFTVRSSEDSELNLAFREGGSLEVTVLTHDGTQPVRGASVRVLTRDGAHIPFRGNDPWLGTVDAEGIAVFTNLPTGSFQIEVTQSDYYPKTVTVNVQTGRTTTETVRLDATNIVN
jgi:protocatechuate 3,4-dioxygenase beta subunit